MDAAKKYADINIWFDGPSNVQFDQEWLGLAKQTDGVFVDNSNSANNNGPGAVNNAQAAAGGFMSDGTNGAVDEGDGRKGTGYWSNQNRYSSMRMTYTDLRSFEKTVRII
jgi:hypothetical protein